MSYAQIGYQVSLLNTATGEPRANEKVSCVIQLSNSEGATICSETKSVTSNDFGVISLTVGNADTFKDMDWNKLPLYISVSIDGKLVGQSQVLTVPVAEYAKKTGTLTYENIGEKKIISNNGRSTYSEYYWKYTYTFVPNSHTVREVYTTEETNKTSEGKYYIDGNSIWFTLNKTTDDARYTETYCAHYIPEIDAIIVVHGD